MTSPNGNISALLCASTNFWANDRETGDLSPHCAHYDGTVMTYRFQHKTGLTSALKVLLTCFFFIWFMGDAFICGCGKRCYHNRPLSVEWNRCFLSASRICLLLVLRPCEHIRTRSHMTPPWWRHHLETCSALLVLCEGNSPVTGELPSQRDSNGASLNRVRISC